MIGLASLFEIARSPIGRVIGVSILVLAALVYGYVKGQGDAGNAYEAAILRARVAILQRDNEISKEAEAEAERRRQSAEIREKSLAERLADYEADIQTNADGGKPDNGLLDASDVERLRGLTR